MRRSSLFIIALVVFASLATSAYAVQYIVPSNNANQSIGASNLLYLDNTNGRIGVGTTNPQSKFHIVSASAQSMYLGYDANLVSYLGTRSDGNFQLYAYNSSSSTYKNILLAVDGSTTAAGNVGIGDTTPTNKLDVNGAIGISDTTVIDASRNIVNAGTGAFSGALSSTTLNTGQGAYELYAMDQNVLTTSAPTFATVNTGNGAYELYAMDQNVLTTSAPTFATINTGNGAMEVNSIAAYTGNQNLGTGDSPTFVRATMSQATGTAPFTVASTTVVTNLNADLVDGQSYNANWPTTLANIQSATTSDFHNIGGTDDDNPDSDAEVPDAITVSGGTIGSNTISSGALWTTAGTLTIGDAGDRIDINSNTWTVTNGAIAGVTTLNTGQGAYELYAMDQNVLTTSAPTFATVNTGNGAYELYAMDQNVLTTSAPTFATINTGNGAMEVNSIAAYTGNQNLGTGDSPTFSALLIGDGSLGTPGLRFSSDTNTGIYRGGADNMSFVAGGTQRIMIENTTGNVVITVG